MPKYNYLCSCGTNFNKFLSLEKQNEKQKCPSCSSLVSKLMPEGFNSKFQLSANSISPQNTGVHDFDTNPDRVIGQHSKQSWGVMGERRDEKLYLMDKNDVTGDYIAHGDNGHYRVMKEEEKEEFQKRTKIVQALLKKQKDSSNQ